MREGPPLYVCPSRGAERREHNAGGFFKVLCGGMHTLYVKVRDLLRPLLRDIQIVSGEVYSHKLALQKSLSDGTCQYPGSTGKTTNTCGRRETFNNPPSSSRPGHCFLGSTRSLGTDIFSYVHITLLGRTTWEKSYPTKRQ